MGGSVQKVLQRRGDKKRKNSGVKSLQFLSPLIISLLLLLAIFSLLTGIVKRYPPGFIFYSISLLSYLLIERFLKARSERPMRLLHEETERLTTTIKQEEPCSLMVRSCHRVFSSSLVSLIQSLLQPYCRRKEISPYCGMT
ncbi:MAG: hypothetical protein ACK4TF_08640 [Thermodesulfovibrionales bacterium]